MRVPGLLALLCAAYLCFASCVCASNNVDIDIHANRIQASHPLDPSWPSFRPPAVPLLVADPYLSVWSSSDSLSESWPNYWTGFIKALCGMIRVDGVIFNWMGTPQQIFVAPFPQVGFAIVRPTTTQYVFRGSGVELAVNFTTPALLAESNFDQLSRPLTYLDMRVSSLDGRSHDVQVYFDLTGEIAVDNATESVVWEELPAAAAPNLRLMRIGTSAQNILGLSGDAVSINWGYMYVGADRADAQLATAMQSSAASRQAFAVTGRVPSTNDMRMPRPVSDGWPVLAFSWNLGNITGTTVATKKRMYLAYDDVFSIKWYGDNLPPLWRHQFPQGAPAMLSDSQEHADEVLQRCYAFDAEMIQNLTAVGGANYAALCSLAFRQATAGTKLVWNQKAGKTWAFLKEISSDGDLSTVDVLFPSSPLYLLYSTELVKLLMLPLFAYANNETSTPYTYRFAPHHLGIYPIGYILETKQENMPMEESGNMLMLTAAVGLAQNSFDFVFPKYASLLKMWAENITEGLPDPGLQLCTDDFEGPTEHNANLAIKGIVGLESYALILEKIGDARGAHQYRSLAHKFAKDWIVLANPNHTKHYRLQYNLEDSWSQKYNLLFARLLPNMVAFPESVFEMESEYYLSDQLQKYGVPLDSRHAWSKLDWTNWIAALTNNKRLWNQIFDRSLRFANDTPQRVPLADWYSSTNSDQMFFKARPVVGGLFARLLRFQGMQ